MFVEQTAKNIKHCGLRDGRDSVHAARTLWSASGEIYFRPAAPDSDCYRDALRVICNAIVIQKIFSAVNPFGNRGQRHGHHFGRVVEQVSTVDKGFVPSVLGDHSDQATLSDPAGRDLRGQVTFPLTRRSNIREYQRHDVAHDFPTLQNLHGWDAQAFLEDFARQPHGTGVRASYVRVVRAVGHIKRRPRCRRNVNRHHHRQVGQMRSPGVGIVEQRNITRPKLECSDCRCH